MKWPSPWLIKTRTVKRFAWLPIVLTSNEYIWLESYMSEEEWTTWPGDCYWSCIKAYQENNK